MGYGVATGDMSQISSDFFGSEKNIGGKFNALIHFKHCLGDFSLLEVGDGLLVLGDTEHGHPQLVIGKVARPEAGSQLHCPGVGAGVDQTAQDCQLLKTSDLLQSNYVR